MNIAAYIASDSASISQPEMFLTYNLVNFQSGEAPRQVHCGGSEGAGRWSWSGSNQVRVGVELDISVP